MSSGFYEDKEYWAWKFEEKLWKKGFRYIAGVDEAGRGALCGPVVAAAVIFKEPFEGWEVIRDSKKLKPIDRLRSYLKIIRNSLNISIGLANSIEIDKINIRNATHKAMIRALENLVIKPEVAIIDGNSIPTYDTEMQCIVKGDERVVSIAASSIIAKVYRDYLMCEYAKKYPIYGFDRHKGYGTYEHISKIKEMGITPWHRLSFKDVQIFRDNLFI